MAEGYDGRELVEVLSRHLAPGATVLELGMGPGKDLEMLSAHFTATGSDTSGVFIARYLAEHPGADVLSLDARSVKTDRTFNSIYSNKVLQHLLRDELPAALERQTEILTDGGVMVHSFWYGEEDEDFDGLHFAYYTEHSLREALPRSLEVLEVVRYREMEPDDSIYLVARKRDSTPEVPTRTDRENR